MHPAHAFDAHHLELLKAPQRLEDLPPEAIWDALGAPHAQSLVDLGCGPGVFTLHFARKMPQGRVYGADLAPEALRLLAREAAEAGLHGIVPVQTGPTLVPLPDGIADVVVAIDVYHHLPDPAGSLAECLRLLKPGGTLAVVDWTPGDSPKGPPQHLRVAAHAVHAELARAGFTHVHDRGLRPLTYCVTGRKG